MSPQPVEVATTSASRVARVRRRVAWTVTAAAARLGLADRLLAPRPVRRVLVYHGVDRAGRKDLNGRFVGVEQLDGHLRWLAEHAAVVPLPELLDGAAHPVLPTVAVTFDDGHATALAHVAPLLARHRLPATFFVTAIRAAKRELMWPDAVDLAARWVGRPVVIDGDRFVPAGRELVSESTGQLLAERAARMSAGELDELVDTLLAGPLRALDLQAVWEYWRPLDRGELGQLAAVPGVSIGAHGVRHSVPDLQPESALREELEVGRAWLEEATGRTVDLLAWPFGRTTYEGVELAREAGFRHQLLTDEPVGRAAAIGDLHARLTVNPFVPVPVVMRAMLRGKW